MSYTVAAFYRFASIQDPASKREPLLALCRTGGIRGTVILAVEGVNGTVAGEAKAIEDVINHIRRWPEINELDVKYSHSSTRSFNRMKVKIKSEIVTMGKPAIDPTEQVGKYVDPEDWNALISRDDVLVVDTRNSFEVGVGRFANAVNPETASFHEFPAWADRLASAPDKPSAVAMYCTGGIRCEKATAYMKMIGFDEVFHLKGGILKYLEKVPVEQSLWEGECFVFDDRVSVKHGLVEGDYILCYGCQNPVSAKDRESPLFEEGVSCPECHDELSDQDRKRYRERQRQVTLAAERGEHHMRDDATLNATNEPGSHNPVAADASH